MRVSTIILACLALSLGFLSCDDGEIKLSNINFDDKVKIQTCKALDVNETVFFKIQKKESLILQLEQGILQNTETLKPILSTISKGKSSLTYRLFSENISKNYFCSKVPPIKPSVEKNIEAKGGKVIITTVKRVDKGTEFYDHLIEVEDFLLEDPDGGRIVSEKLFFGIYTTRSSQN